MTCLKASLYSVDNTTATEQIWDGVEYMHWPVEFSFQKKAYDFLSPGCSIIFTPDYYL